MLLSARPPSSRIVVLGMHRSGTSAVTGLLVSLGYHAGDEDELTGRSWENPLGFFERRDVRSVTDALMHAADGEWWRVSKFDQRRIPPEIVAEQRSAFRRILDSLEDHPRWIVKDPRLSLLLPVLEDVLPPITIVNVYRNPLEVADSLAQRNGIPTDVGLALWELYTRSIAQSSGQHRLINIDYNVLVSDPLATTKRLCSLLDIAPPREASLVHPELRRHRASRGDLTRIAPSQIALYNALKEDERIDVSLPAISESTMKILSAFEEANPTLPKHPPPPADATHSTLPLGRRVQIVVCVHNALEHVKFCLDSLSNTTFPIEHLRLILVDDGSDDETARYLRSYAAEAENTSVVRTPSQLGYTRAVNFGIRNSDPATTHFALLNSDTVVSPSWLEDMLVAFDRSPDVGIVGPLSNAASWQSIPEVKAERGWAVNELPQGVSVQAAAAALNRLWLENPVFPRVATLNGFCLLVRREVFAAIGDMDEALFPNGFGEETDFCFRASDAGFGLVVATNAYVFHAKSKSYGAEARNSLSSAGNLALQGRYPNGRIVRATDSLRINPILASVRQRFPTAILERAEPPHAVADAEAPTVSTFPFSTRRAMDLSAAIRLAIEGSTPTVHDIGDGASATLHYPAVEKHHRNFAGSLPHSNGVETSFRASPGFTVLVPDGVVDTATGTTLIDGHPLVAASFVTGRLAGHYKRPPAAAWRELGEWPSIEPIMPMASHRMANYCRWWLDSVGKAFLFAATGPSGTKTIVRSGSETPAQLDALTGAFPGASIAGSTTTLVRCSSVNSPGLCYQGGQNISAAAIPLAAHLRKAFALDRMTPSRRLYLSRRKAKFRRVLNEDDLLPSLQDLGFEVLFPEDFSLREQARIFAEAEIVLGPHGAGFTNIIFCNPAARIVEMFPEGGLHGSAFLRLSSHLEFPYFHVVGQQVSNPFGDLNPNNNDLILDPTSLVSFLRTVVQC